ncbi:MAG: dTDP-4-dehydrorhamnose 3,5-epimerase [Actinomycetes bacterium]|jgi:dTDP-4-dehydrorhamnose 3,5-epimerase|nr:MAG: dTDP-4-dehydrorhamnose 3,5-epimerase [Actinomycetota bacterium]
MRFLETGLHGVFLVESDLHADERGWFARSYEEDTFAAHGLATRFPHHNLSYNHSTGILRGLHYQLPPHGEVKVVRCLTGAIYDVVVDLRPASPTHRRWEGFVLDRPGLALYVPEGFAHGYQVLEGPALVSYLMGDVYEPSLQRGLRWDDPAIEIDWPMEPKMMTERDAGYPDVDWERAWPAG